MEKEYLDFEYPEPAWCSAPIALGVGRGEKRRVLYASRELLMLHSPVFERMLAEGSVSRGSESGAVIELPDDDPEEFDELLSHIFFSLSFNPECILRLASKYRMEDLIRDFDHYFKPEKVDNSSDLSLFIRWLDGASLPRTKAAVFHKVCIRQWLDELRNDDVWGEISATLRLELTEHYHDDQRKAGGREGFCSIVVPEIQWPNLLTFESPAAEHCGGVSSLRLIVGRGKEKRVLYCSKELIFSLFPTLREKLRNCGDSLELEDGSADGFVYSMNWALKKRPWEAFSVYQQSAMLCLASKYRGELDFRALIDSSESFTLCHKLYLAEQCHLDDLQKKYADEIRESVAKLDEARESEWWPQLSAELSAELQSSLYVVSMSRSSTPQSIKEEDLFLEDPNPDWCSAPTALGVGCGSQRRVLYFSRELLILHSPVFARMLVEGSGSSESEPGAVIELPDDDPKEFEKLLELMLCSCGNHHDCALDRASQYQMEDLIRYFDSWASVQVTRDSFLRLAIRYIDGASLPRTKALVFRKVCTHKRLDELRNDAVWKELSATLRLELTEHYYDDQKKANGKEEFCSINVPEIQWPNLPTFESPAREHCGGVASLRLIVGRGEEKRVLYCSRELIFALFPALREKLHNGCDSLELEEDSADGFVYLMNCQLLKRPWEDFSVHQQSAMLCLASKYQGWLNVYRKIDSSESFTLCHKLYLAEQCRLEDLQKKYAGAIRKSAAKLDEARRSEWWPQLSNKLRSSFARMSKDAPDGSESKEKKQRHRVSFAASLMYTELYFAEEAQRILRGNARYGRQRRNALLEDIRQKVNKKHGVNVPEWFWVKHIKNLKGAAKKEAANRKSVSRATGGGPSGAHFKDPRIEIILAAIAKQPSMESTPGRTGSMRESATEVVKDTLLEHRTPSTGTRCAFPIERDDDVLVLSDDDDDVIVLSDDKNDVIVLSDDDVLSSHSQEPTTSDPPNKRSRRDHATRTKCDTFDKSPGPSSSQHDSGTKLEKVDAEHALAEATERRNRALHEQNQALREQIELLERLKDLQK